MIPLTTTFGGKSVKVHSVNHDMLCNNCDKFLGTLVESDEPNRTITKPTHYKAICTCGGDSFLKKSSNKCFMVPEEGWYIKDQTFEIKENHVDCKIFLEKL